MTAGSSPQTFALINSLGIEMVEQVPSLFTFNIDDKSLHELAGISVEWAFIKIKSLKIQSEGPLLITHWGVSGPAVLRMSAYAARELNKVDYHFKIEINWRGGEETSSVVDTLKWYKESNARKNVGNQNPFQFSSRLWRYFLNKIQIAHLNWADISNKKLDDLARCICEMEFDVTGKSTFKDEFVTAGGVKLSEVDFKTMESKKLPGLYFAGEVLDIDAVTGGFNFQAAWTTAMLAANSISKTLEDKKSY
ncbi:MAG: aminoacetone oxidase family FAD-binding enzyme [Flavobacteriales bacterium]